MSEQNKVFLKMMGMILILVVIDQYSKYYIFSLLAQTSPPVIQITSFFNLVMVKNYGISFGMLNALPHGQWILSIVALIIVGILLIWLRKAKERLVALALSLIIGGAVGNIIDRIRLGAVSDFLDFHFSGYHWPAFNAADSFICIGVAILLYENFIHKEERTT